MMGSMYLAYKVIRIIKVGNKSHITIILMLIMMNLTLLAKLVEYSCLAVVYGDLIKYKTFDPWFLD